MKKGPKRGTAIIFPGRPETLGLLKDFILYLKRRCEKVIIFDKYFLSKISRENPEEIFKGMADPIIGFSYSAGVIDMLDFAANFPKKFSPLIMIAPAGTREEVPSFFEHIILFIWEMLKLVFHRRFRIFFVVAREILADFFSNPREFFREIKKIKNFRLYEEILERIYVKIDFAFIFPAKDRLLPLGSTPYFVGERFIIESESSGHFGFLEKPGLYWELFREL